MDRDPFCISDEMLEMYLTNEIGLFARLRVEAHLSHCEECRLALRTIAEEVA